MPVGTQHDGGCWRSSAVECKCRAKGEAVKSRARPCCYPAVLSIDQPALGTYLAPNEESLPRSRPGRCNRPCRGALAISCEPAPLHQPDQHHHFRHTRPLRGDWVMLIHQRPATALTGAGGPLYGFSLLLHSHRAALISFDCFSKRPDLARPRLSVAKRSRACAYWSTCLVLPEKSSSRVTTEEKSSARPWRRVYRPYSRKNRGNSSGPHRSMGFHSSVRSQAPLTRPPSRSFAGLKWMPSNSAAKTSASARLAKQ